MGPSLLPASDTMEARDALENEKPLKIAAPCWLDCNVVRATISFAMEALRSELPAGCSRQPQG